MSIDLMTQVWKSDAYDGGTLLVLLALADWANDDGTSIFPKIATMAKKARLCERQVQNCLKTMRDDGVLVKVAEAKRGRGTEYRLVIERVKTLPRNKCVAKVTGEAGFQKGAQSIADVGTNPISPPIEEPPVEPLWNRHSDAPGSASDRPPSMGWKEFRQAVVETWPNAFPSDDDAKARKAFAKAILTIQPETLIACARAHGAVLTARKAARAGAPGPFLFKLPSNWLKDHGFDGYAAGIAAEVAAEAERAVGLARAQIGLGIEAIQLLRDVGMTDHELAKMDGVAFDASAACFTVATPFQGEILRRYGSKLQRSLGTEDLLIVLAGTERRSA